MFFGLERKLLVISTLYILLGIYHIYIYIVDTMISTILITVVVVFR